MHDLHELICSPDIHAFRNCMSLMDVLDTIDRLWKSRDLHWYATPSMPSDYDDDDGTAVATRDAHMDICVGYDNFNNEITMRVYGTYTEYFYYDDEWGTWECDSADLDWKGWELI